MQTVHGAIAARAQENPTRIAVRDAERTLDYAALEDRAARVARALAALGVKPGDHVGVYLGRSVDLVAGVLGVMKTGAAFVPLDPEFPAERIEMMVADAGLRVVVTEQALLERAPGAGRVVMERLADEGDAAWTDAGGPDDAAYVIYTSGSTGRPKGVRVAHRSVVNLLTSIAAEPGIDADDVWLAVTTLSFDISILELFGPLVAGATTAVATREEVLDGRLLAAALERARATIMQATPVGWRLLLESGWAGDRNLTALSGGDFLPPDLAATLVQRTAALWNMYGPTETTIWSTCYRVPESGSPVLIGRPVANTTVYVLDRMLRPLPPGVPGEIWIGGAGVALGYHDRPELTGERFLLDPFSGVPGARMYRTGDQGRILRDGNLEFRSRVDHQVKIRGFRVEPAEIEAAIVATGLAREAAVVAKRGDSADDRLVAFVVPLNGSGADAHALRARLRDSLPGYMVPNHFVDVASLPVTPNGKVDRQALEAGTRDIASGKAERVAPRNDAEAIVARVIADVLQVEAVGVDEDFFDIGGHSVLAMRVVARLRDAGASSLTLRDMFESTTVAEIAARIQRTDGEAFAGDGGIAGDDTRELLVF